MAILVVAFAATLGISYWAREASRPEVSQPPAPPTTDGVAGWPKNVDPIKTLERARELTPRRLLRQIALEGVRPDGTLDVQAGGGQARYVFQSSLGRGPQPPREPGTLPIRAYCGRQVVRLDDRGLAADPDLADHHCAAGYADALPDPACTPKQLWDKAKYRRFPSDKPARVEYFRANDGPAWRFSIPGTRYAFTVYGDCERELRGSDAMPASR